MHKNISIHFASVCGYFCLLVPFALSQDTHRLATTVKLESAPVCCWVSPNNRKLVITTSDNQVIFYDLREGRMINRIRLDAAPLFIHPLPDAKLAVIGHWGGRRISVIDLYGNRFMRSAPVGDGPTFFGQFSQGLLVVLAREQKLSFLSKYTLRPVREVTFNGPVSGLAVAPRRGRAYVAVAMKKIAVIDLSLKKLSHMFDAVTARETPLVVDPQERWLFALSPRNAVVRISLDEEKETKRISTGSGPIGMKISDDGRYLYVTNGLEGKLAVFDAETLSELEQIAVGVKPAWIDVSRDNRYVFVCNRGSMSISILERMAQSLPEGRSH